ncbi:MAG: DsbC family protein, partial [Desulfuromonadales bacterium]
HSLTIPEANGLVKKIGVSIDSVMLSPARGLFEMLFEKDGQKGILFMDFGKKHLIQGTVFDLEKLEPIAAHKNVLPKPKQMSTIDVKNIPAQLAVVMGNPKGTKKLYVFTDPDCPYCRKGHLELKKLASIDKDVAIYVMLFPLPMHPGAYDKSRTVLETKSLDLLDKAFDGKEVPKPTKESSKQAIDEIIMFASVNGISSTPTVVMPNGTVQSGMPDAETLKRMLEVK